MCSWDFSHKFDYSGNRNGSMFFSKCFSNHIILTSLTTSAPIIWSLLVCWVMQAHRHPVQTTAIESPVQPLPDQFVSPDFTIRSDRPLSWNEPCAAASAMSPVLKNPLGSRVQSGDKNGDETSNLNPLPFSIVHQEMTTRVAAVLFVHNAMQFPCFSGTINFCNTDIATLLNATLWAMSSGPPEEKPI